MELNLAKTVVSYLKAHPDEKFTARQIAEWVFATYPEQCQAKKQSSQYLETDAELVQQIVREISSQLPRLQRKHLELNDDRGAAAQALLLGPNGQRRGGGGRVRGCSVNDGREHLEHR